MAISTSIISTPPDVSFARIPNVVKVKVSGIEIGQTQIYVNIMVRRSLDGLDYFTIMQESKMINSNGIAVFDISTAFTNLFKPDFIWPEHFTNLHIRHDEMAITYAVAHWCSYLQNGIRQTSDPSATLPLKMIDGGANIEDIAELNTSGSNLFAHLRSKLQFLTNSPSPKTTYIGAAEKLYYYFQGFSQARLTITAFNSETSITHSENFELAVLYAMYEFSVSPETIIALTSIQNISKYTILLEGSHNNFATEEVLASFTFLVNNFNTNQPIPFFFTNSLGGVDVVNAIGATRIEMELERQNFSISTISDPIMRDRYSKQSRAQAITKYKTNSGWLISDKQMAHLADLLFSNTVFKITGQRVEPILIDTTKVNLFDNMRNQPHQLLLEYSSDKKATGISSISAQTIRIYAPYMDRVSDFYYAFTDGEFVNKTSDNATTDGDSITFESLADGLFNFTDRDFWKSSVEALAWYNSESPNIGPSSFFTMENIIMHGTPETNARLFCRDYAATPSSILPIVAYSEALTIDEQTVVGKWLDTYFALTENGSLLTQNSKIVTQKYNS